jgi:hypothetical protein
VVGEVRGVGPYRELPYDANGANDTNSALSVAATAELAIELGRWPEVQQNSQVDSRRGDVIPELAAGGFGYPFCSLDFDDHATLHEHIDPVKANPLTAEGYDNGVLPIDSQAFLLHG